MALDRRIFSGMDSDSADRDLQNGDYRSAKNLVAVSDGVTNGVRRENLLGMLKKASPASENAVCVGAFEYVESQKAYLCFYDIADSVRRDAIYEYDIPTQTFQRVIRNAILNFDVRFLVIDMFVIEDLLYFNDGNNDLRKVNITQGKSGAYDGLTSDNTIKVIKRKPKFPATVSRETIEPTADDVPGIRFTPYQFATRYVYLDDEVSLLSPVSELAPYADYYEDDEAYNTVKVRLQFDYDELKDVVKRIDLVVREKNTGNWYKYDELQVSMFAGAQPIEGTASSTTAKGEFFYIFRGDRAGAILSDLDIRSAESVPRKSSSMAFMENRMFAVSTLEEYDVEESNWDALITISATDKSFELNDDIYLPRYYKPNSRYVWGIVFEDEDGRESAASVRSGMEKKTPFTDKNYTLGVDLRIYSHPQMISASVVFTGKPPTWAKRYKVVRTNNLSFSSWFAAKCPIRFLYNTQNYETPDEALELIDEIFWEAGYYYYNVEKALETLRGNFNAGLPFDVDAVHVLIPDGLPIPVDENSIIRMAYTYPIGAGRRKQQYAVQEINNGRMLISGLGWVEWEKVLFTEAVYHNMAAILTADNEDLYNDETFLNIEIANPLKLADVDSVLFYETGRVYNVVNPGTDSRAFQSNHDDVPGDCYQTGFSDTEESRRLRKADGEEDQTHRNALSRALRSDRRLKTISYASLSPIADRDRKDEFDDALSSNNGQITVAVEEQSEKSRGNQIRYSNRFIADSFVNGLSNFPEENKYAISADRGDVIKLAKTNEKVLLAIHKRSMTSLYINERIVKTSADASVLSTTVDVVGDDRKLLLDIGSNHPESIVVNNNRVYGFDSTYGEPWRRSLDGVTPLGTPFKMKTYFEEVASLIRTVQRIDPQAVIKIYGGYDLFIDMYVIAFAGFQYTDGEGVVQTVPTRSLGFSEKAKRWISFFDYDPEYFVSINNNLASVRDSALWIHQEGIDRNKFYDEAKSSSITFSFVDSNDSPKIFQNMAVSSNKKWSMTGKTPEGKSTRLSLNNFILKDNMFYANILRNENTPSDVLDSGQTPLLHGDIMIGNTLEVTLTNEDTEKVTLDAVYAGYSLATGHLLAVNN